jgi:prevent-host-death family protein
VLSCGPGVGGPTAVGLDEGGASPAVLPPGCSWVKTARATIIKATPATSAPAIRLPAITRSLDALVGHLTAAEQITDSLGPQAIPVHGRNTQPRRAAQLGRLVRRAVRDHERITITDDDAPAAVVMSADELEDLEDALAVAQSRLREAAWETTWIPHEEVRWRLDLDR